MSNFLAELKRRNVIRVGLFYLVTGWLILQAGDVLFALVGLPEWTLKLVAAVLLLGLPIALVFSWIYEMTPEGIKLEKDVDRSRSITPATGRKLNSATGVVAVVAIVVVFAQQAGMLPGARIATPEEPVSRGATESVDEPVVDEQPILVEEPVSEPVPSGDDRPSVAVLPFADMSPGKDQEYFSDGLADTLMHVLAQVQGLKVAARTSSFAFKGKNMDVGQIAEQLGVATLLEGSVQKSGDKIRVIAQLIDARDGSHLWSRNFDRNLEDIFAVQDEIAQEVVQALQVTLLDTDQKALVDRYQPTLEAYEQFILGRREMATRRIDPLLRAAGHFKKAIEMDGEYTLAYINLADVYSLLQFYGDLDTIESVELRRPLLDRALALDPESGEAYASLGQVHWDLGEYDEADRLMRRAIELNPNYATAYHWYSVQLRFRDRNEEGLAMIRKAAELDPIAPIIRTNVAETLIMMGRIEEAEVMARSNIELNPDFPNHLFDLRWLSWLQGDLGQAMRWGDALVAVDPNQSRYRGEHCAMYLELVDPQASSSCFARLRQDLPESTNAQRIEATTLRIHQGDHAAAIRQLSALLEGEKRNTPDRREIALELSWVLSMDGQTTRARDVLAEAWPGLFTGDLPGVYRLNFQAAGLAAWLLSQTGDSERADRLLDDLDAYMAKRHRTRGLGFGLEDVAAQTIRGHHEQALALIREAIDQRWRGGWWWYFRHDPRLKPLHDDPEFQALVAEVEQDMLAQRAWYEAHRDEPIL